jgi:hypothetical protein
MDPDPGGPKTCGSVDPVDPDPQHWSPPYALNVPSLVKVVRILQARAEKLVVGPKGRYRGSESREEELHEHLFYSQVPSNGVISSPFFSPKFIWVPLDFNFFRPV